MKERVLSRISVNIEAYFIYKNERFTGTVKYLSKKGYVYRYGIASSI